MTMSPENGRLDGEWVVLKFGGTSVSTELRWGIICRRVNQILAEGARVWVVISALSQVTNKLERCVEGSVKGENVDSIFREIVQQHLDLAISSKIIDDVEARNLEERILDEAQRTEDKEALLGGVDGLRAHFWNLKRLLKGIRLTEEASPSIRARVIGTGELLSTALGVAIMDKNGLKARLVDARRLLIDRSESTRSSLDGRASRQVAASLRRQPEDRYLQATVQPMVDKEKAGNEAAGSAVVLTQGFIAGLQTPNGVHTCVLGRGGSDTSGSLFAALLQANRYEVWTDVHGLFTSDPRQIPSARLIKEINYREAQELAAMGAKVLHPRCIVPAQWAKIPIQIRNTNDPDKEGTWILERVDSYNTKIMAVVRRQDVTLLTVTAFDMCGQAGFLSSFFRPFEELGVSVDLIATSQYSVSITMDYIPGGTEGRVFFQLLERLQELGEVEARSRCAVVSIVGRRLRTVLHKFSEAGVLLALKDKEVLLLTESAEDLNFSFVVDQRYADEVVAEMHERLLPKAAQRGNDVDVGFLPLQKSASCEKLFGETWTDLRSRGESKVVNPINISGIPPLPGCASNVNKRS